MLYVNKKSNKVVELLYSDNKMCIYVSSKLNVDASGEGEVGTGIVFKGNKKSFKRFFKKANKKIEKGYHELDEAAKEEVYSICLGDSYGLLNHTAEYIEGNMKLEDKEWNEFHKNMTEEEREEMLEDLKDK